MRKVADIKIRRYLFKGQIRFMAKIETGGLLISANEDNLPELMDRIKDAVL